MAKNKAKKKAQAKKPKLDGNGAAGSVASPEAESDVDLEKSTRHARTQVTRAHNDAAIAQLEKMTRDEQIALVLHFNEGEQAIAEAESLRDQLATAKEAARLAESRTDEKKEQVDSLQAKLTPLQKARDKSKKGLSEVAKEELREEGRQAALEEMPEHHQARLKELKKLRPQLKKAQESLVELAPKLLALEELGTLRTQLQNAEKYKELDQACRKSLNGLKVQKATLETEKTNLEIRVAGLESELEESSGLREEMNQAKADYADGVEENTKLKAELVQAERDISEAKDAANKSFLGATNLTENLETIEADFAETKGLVTSLKADLTEAQDRSNVLTEVLNARNDAVDAQARDIKVLKNQIKS